MEIEEDINQEISEKEENKEESDKNISKKSSKLSSGTKNDENIDNNINKEIKRMDTYSSLTLKIESSNNINEANKSESETIVNKNSEINNTQSSTEKKRRKKKTIRIKDSIQTVLSKYLLEIILKNNENINLIFKRQQYKLILEEIKKTNNYYEIYKSISNLENRKLNEILNDNKKYLNKPLLIQNISSKDEIELEFYKYGKTFKKPIRKRYGIITDNNFYSSTQPIAKFNKKNAKLKTNYILNAKEILKEKYDKENDKDKIEWHNEDKLFRLKINYENENNEKNCFFFYFLEEKDRDSIFNLIKLIQLEKRIKEPANEALKSMEKLFTQNNKIYTIVKILSIKRKITNKIKIKKYINNQIKEDKKELNIFMGNINTYIKNKYIIQRKSLYNKGIQRKNKYLILNSEILGKKGKNIYTLNDIKSACNTIYKYFHKPYYVNNNKKENNNSISFKVNYIQSNNNENFMQNNLSFNYKEICIKYVENRRNNNNIFLDKNDIFNISNIIYNYNIVENKNEFKLLILGPYKNNNNNFENNFSFDLKLKDKNIKNIYDKYIENNSDRFEYLICQIFNIEINKLEVQNSNFTSSIKENDYFYLNIIGGFNDNLLIKTKLFNPKIIKDNKIIIELNLELYIPYQFFDNEEKNIKVILYYLNNNDTEEIKNKNLYTDYINKIEINKFFLDINTVSNMPNYEMLFDGCIKSKIFWNLIIQNDPLKNKEIYYINKNFKIGNKFYYLENVDYIKNINEIIDYYKYEKVEKYLKNDKNNKNKIYMILCEYIGMNKSKEIIFYNLISNEYKIEKYDKTKFVLFQNNNFNIINNEIIYNFNKNSNSNFIRLFEWFKIISFRNEVQMLALIEILKKLRRLSIYDYFNNKIFVEEKEYKSPYGHKIDENILYKKLKEDDKSKNNFKIILELNKLELINDDKIEDVDFKIDILSRPSTKNINENKNEINTNKLNLLNIFLKNANKYENNLIKNNKKINSLRSDKINQNYDNFNVCTDNHEIKYNKSIFGKNGRIINFDLLNKKEKKIEFVLDIFNHDIIIIKIDLHSKEQNKIIKILQIFIDINKDFFNSLLIKNSIKKNSLLNENFNFNDIYADFLILPAFSTSKNNYDFNKRIIFGILTFKIICFNPNLKKSKNIDIDSYDKISKKYISDYIDYCIDNKKELIDKLGIYEPNIFKNNISSKIMKSLNQKYENNNYINNNINNYYNKGILNESLIPDNNFGNEKNSIYIFHKFIKYIYKYKINSVYDDIIEYLWKIHIKKDKNIYDNFPSKEELIKLYKTNNNFFYKIKRLIYMGLPNLSSRKIIWDKLLNIEYLVKQTAIKLSNFNLYNIKLNEKDFVQQKGEIYNLLNNISNQNKLSEYLSLIDNIIDLDVINIKCINGDIEYIKKIAIIFYQWSLLNIGETSDANAINNVSEIKNINEIFYKKNFQRNEYSYYSGMLYLCLKLFKYFKSPSETFWYLVGLSQIIPMFNINYNSYELTVYNLVIKLILEEHHNKLYKKIISLNFPIEFFFSSYISCFYSSFFNDIELYIKVLDILIFEGSLSINNYRDPINHLRVLCAIILTVLVDNEDKINEVENIYQLDNLFNLLKFKKYNIKKFLEKINDNIYKYFNNNDDNKEKGIINNNKWENKRIKIEKILDKYYFSYIRNVYSYLKNNFKNFSLTIQNNSTNFFNDKTNRINILLWKEKIRNSLNKYANKENKKEKKKSNRGLIIIFREIKILNFKNYNEKKEFVLIGESEINLYSKNEKYLKNEKEINKKIRINEKGNIYNFDKNDKYCLIDYKYHLKDDSNLIISLCNTNGKEEELFIFQLNIDSIELLKPIRLEIHSNKSFIESAVAILEISTMKYYDFLLSDDYCKLYLSFFSPNEFQIDSIIKSKYLEFKNIPNISELITEENGYNKIEDILCENIHKIYNEKLSLIYKYYLERNFLCSNKKFYLDKDDTIFEEIKIIINELFLINGSNEITEKIINLIKNENNVNNITIMEILICIYLDNDIMNLNMNDILHNLYDFTMIKNKKNICTISNVVELVYILYKKYSVFYEYKQVKNMVNYFFKKEKFSFIKSVLIFNKAAYDKTEQLFHNNNNDNIKQKYRDIKNIIDVIDITFDFIFIYDNFFELSDIFNLYNRLDLNPQSKNNVILILKIILYDIFIRNKENNLHKQYDYNSFDFIIIEYYKEFTSEEIFFSFKYNSINNYFDIELKDINNRYGDLNDDYKEKRLQNKSIYELILLYANNNFLFNNNNSEYLEYNISFDEFKKIFTSLPYLNDILLKNIYKLFHKKNFELISNKNIIYDKVNIHIIFNSTKIFEIIFVSNSKTKNYLYNSNFTRIYNSIIINYNIYSSFTIKKIYDIIINKIEYEDFKEKLKCSNLEILRDNLDLIKDSILNYKNLLFYTIDKNNNFNFLSAFLPLYINFSNDNKKAIDIYLDITFSFYVKKNDITHYIGYSIFPITKENEAYQWKKCLIIKEKNQKYYKIKFNCFQNFNKNEKNMKKLTIKNINNEYNIKEKNIRKKSKISEIYKDIIILDDKSMKQNVIINNKTESL